MASRVSGKWHAGKYLSTNARTPHICPVIPPISTTGTRCMRLLGLPEPLSRKPFVSSKNTCKRNTSCCRFLSPSGVWTRYKHGEYQPRAFRLRLHGDFDHTSQAQRSVRSGEIRTLWGKWELPPGNGAFQDLRNEFFWGTPTRVFSFSFSFLFFFCLLWRGEGPSGQSIQTTPAPNVRMSIPDIPIRIDI